MSLTASDLQALIIASLSQAEPTALAKLQTNIPLYWTLHNRVAYPELKYWYVRREAIRLCMACNTREVDYQRRRQNSNRTSVDSSRYDSSMTGVSQEDSVSAADRSSTSVFNSATTSSASGSSSSTRSATQSSAADSAYDDTGAGTNTANRRAHELTDTKERGKVKETSTSDSVLQHLRTAEDKHYLSETINTTYNDINVPIQGDGTLSIPVPVGMDQETMTNSLAQNDNTVDDHVYTNFPSTAGNLSRPDAYRHTHSEIEVLVQPFRSVDTDSYDRPVADAGSSTPSQFSTFTAHVISSDTASSTGSGTGSQTAAMQSQTNGAGAGSSSSVGSSSSSMTATASRISHADGEAQRSMQGALQMDSLMERLHQRFLHLQELWQNANAMIEWLEQQRLALPAYVVRQITLAYPDGVTAGLSSGLTQIANQYLIRQPGAF